MLSPLAALSCPLTMALLMACSVLAALDLPRSAQAADAPDPAITYSNPVGGDISMGDPFVRRYGDTYYLTGTTAVGQGFRMWTSNDLVDWTPVGFAYRRTDQSWGHGSYWAPELFEYRGKYYMVYSASHPDMDDGKPGMRVCLAVADSPTGPYHDLYAPWCDQGYSCIDGDVMIDTDGTPYLYFARVGVIQQPKFKLVGKVYGARLKADLSDVTAPAVLCTEASQAWETPENGRSLCNEGPFVFPHEGRYYLTYSANHYAEPLYGIGYATASNPLGPWKKPADSRLLVADEKLGVSGPGHSCTTTSPDGKEMFIVYHAHKDPAHPGGSRTVNIDRLIVEPDGTLKVLGPTRSPQPLPSGATRSAAH